MWARAIIFGLELIGFIVFFVITIISYYKRNVKEKGKNYAKKYLKDDIIYFITNVGTLLLLFLFTYPSLVFLSYSKLVIVTISVILSVIVLTVLGYNVPFKENTRTSIVVLSIILEIIMLVAAGISGFSIGNKKIISVDEKTQKIAPIMFSENQIAYTHDDNGDIIYSYYYEKDGKMFFKELEDADAEVEYLKGGDSYIEVITTRTEYLDKEKKIPSYVETNETYTIYINRAQMVEVKID